MQQNTTQINPIIPPEAIDFWPPQPGWYVLGILFLFSIFYASRIYFIYKKKNAYRKLALIELNQIKKSKDQLKQLVELNKLLKITAINGFDREDVAQLTGNEWLLFLDISSNKKYFFTKEPGSLLSGVPYRIKNVEVTSSEINKLVELTSNWIKGHKSKYWIKHKQHIEL